MDDHTFLDAAVKGGVISFEKAQEALAAQKILHEEGIDSRIWQVLVVKNLATQEQVDALLAGERVPKTIPFGPYQIEAKLGEGGMGSVYRARKSGVERPVALKVLPERFNDSTLVERFEREAKVAIALSHPNVVKGFEHGKINNRWYYAMEYVKGKGVGQLIGEKRRLDEKPALQIAIQVVQGLDAIHKHGLVHRDIKPDNIIIGEDGIAKLMDLGLVKSTVADVSLTASGLTVGTPYYMSPEQFAKKELDIRADIYSLGATLYCMVTGKVPFDGQSAADVHRKLMKQGLEDPRKSNPALSEGFCRLVGKMMARNPQDRHSSPAELLADLSLVLDGKMPQASAARSAYQPALATRREAAPVPARRAPWPWIGVGAAGAAAAAIAWALMPEKTVRPAAPGRPAKSSSQGVSEDKRKREVEEAFAAALASGRFGDASRLAREESLCLGPAKAQEVASSADKALKETIASARELAGKYDFSGARQELEKLRSRAAGIPQVEQALQEEQAAIAGAEEKKKAGEKLRALEEQLKPLREAREYDKAVKVLEGARATADPALVALIDEQLRLLRDLNARVPAPTPLAPAPTPAPPGPAAAELWARARAQADSEKWDEAISTLARILDATPRDARAYLFRARCFLRKDNVQNAVLDVDESLKIDPADPAALVLAGQLLLRKKEFLKASEVFTRAIAREPSSSEAYWGRAQAVAETRKSWAEVLSDLDEAEKIKPDLGKTPEASALRIRSLEGTDKPDLAIRECGRWAGREPKLVEPYRLRAALYEKTGKAKEARADWEKVLSLDPNHAEGLAARERLARTKALPSAGKPSRPPSEQFKEKILGHLKAAHKQIAIMPDGHVRAVLSYDFTKKEQLEDFACFKATSGKGGVDLAGALLEPASILLRPPFVGDFSARVDLAYQSDPKTATTTGLMVRARRDGEEGVALQLAQIPLAGWTLLMQQTGKAQKDHPAKPVLFQRAGETLSLGFRRQGAKFTGTFGRVACETPEAYGPDPVRLQVQCRDAARVLRLEVQGTLDPEWARLFSVEPADARGTPLWNGRDLGMWDVIGEPFRIEGGALVSEGTGDSTIILKELLRPSRLEMTIVFESAANDGTMGFALVPDDLINSTIALVTKDSLAIFRIGKGKDLVNTFTAPLGAPPGKGELRLELAINGPDLVLSISGSGELRAPGAAPSGPIRPAAGIKHVKGRITSITYK